MKIKAFSVAILAFGLMSGVQAADYPPALIYDNLPELLQIGNADGTLFFGRHLPDFKLYLPERQAQVRIDIVDAQGKVLTTKERVFNFHAGRPIGEIDGNVFACANDVKCIDGASKLPLAPGVYWLVLSENQQPFSAEWFEVRSAGQGEGRFAKQTYFTLLPQEQMAGIGFNNQGKGDMVVDLGLASGSSETVVKPLRLILKRGGKPVAQSPGNKPQPVTLYPYTSLIQQTLVTPKNANFAKADLTDGAYQLEAQLDGKAVRHFNFTVKGGKIVYQGRQQETSQPAVRQIVSQDRVWIWNADTKEPMHQLPKIAY